MSAIPIPPRALRQLIVDTTIATPATGHFLRYNGTKWVNVALVVGDIPSLAGTYQPIDADLTSWAAVTRGSGFDTFAATPTSANLRSLVSDETGTGALVFATSPTLTTPVLGAATGTSLALFGSGLSTLVLGNTTSASTATPVTINSGGTFADSPVGAKAKWKMYDDGTSIFGIGISSGQFNFFCNTTGAFKFHWNDVEKASITSAGALGLSAGISATTASFTSTLSVTGASTFDSRINLKSYIVSTLPAAGVAGGVVYVSDAGGNGPCLAISNGTNWKRCDNTGTTVS